MLNLANYKKEILAGTFRVSLDSRLIQPGEYFVAIKGENHDGHAYIGAVLDKGAAGILEVEDLYELAGYKINSIKPIIVGITGSTGKSSVTSIITQLLEKKYPVCKGSLNTKLGLSFDVINNMHMDCKVFVAEMGMNGLGQIKSMTYMFKPHIAVITTINQTHAEKLGSIANIVKAKSEILECCTNNDVAVLNSDNIYTRKIGKQFNGKVLWFGTKKSADYTPKTFDLSKSRLLGLPNQLNLLASVAVAKEIGLTDTEIIEAIPKVTTPKGRLNLLNGINGSKLIDDTYNASPVSTHFAIDILTEFPAKRRIAILGDMLELGKFAKLYHKRLGAYLKDKHIDVLVTVGNLTKLTNDEAKKHISQIFHLKDPAYFHEFIATLQIDKNTVVLIKGSQGIRMEKISRILLQNPVEAGKLLVRQDIRWK